MPKRDTLLTPYRFSNRMGLGCQGPPLCQGYPTLQRLVALSQHQNFHTNRKQDVRATEVDAVAIADSYRPGDLVLAEVLSLGDSRSYFLGTARNELGVVHARHFASGGNTPPLKSPTFLLDCRPSSVHKD